MRRSRTALAGVSAGVILATAVVSAPSATAAPADPADTAVPVIVSVDVSPEPVVLYKDRMTTIRFRVRATDDTGIASLAAVAFSKSDDAAGGSVPLALTSGTARNGVWTASIKIGRYEVPGQWAAVAFAVDAAGNESVWDESPYDLYRVKRRTVIDRFNVGPEPVRRGAPVTVSGRLRALHPDRGFVASAAKVLQLEFKARGAKTFTKVATVTTTSKGTFRMRRVSARFDGTWRVTFAGTGSNAPAVSRGDFVDVR